MPPLYDQTGYDNSDEDFIGSKIKGWQSGNRRDALDLADFYAAQGDEEQASHWARLADDTEILLGHLHSGLALIETAPARAAQHLIAAFNGLRTEAIAPLHQLLQLNSAERLRMPPDEHSRVFVQLQEILERKAAIELRTALLTGTRPVLFQKIPGPATYDNAQWGGGSLFVVIWHGVHFAVTALHVIENLGAERKEFRLLVPGTEVTLEMYGGVTPSKAPRLDRDELDDIYAWHIRGLPDGYDELGWWSWKLDQWNRPASELKQGQSLYAAGYPDVEDRYDPENFKIVPIASILHGRLGNDTGVEGIYTMDVDEVDHPMNLMSGGPVFASIDGFLHYVGMILRGDADVRKIYFIDSTYVIALLERHNHGAH
ncbi:hypothetical protein [Pseudomonas syringae]|uniref:hypothetical protein n=1 Tax=Pseudomonas syringae TaxID=317 RepID=UPI000943F5BA|nr:hypothetical protein [Pseudomonas syringae]